jgi:DNA end-binding protein Ku
MAAAVPGSGKTLSVLAFIGCDEIDEVYFDKPYYLAPADKQGSETSGLIGEGLRKTKVAAMAQAVLFLS